MKTGRRKTGRSPRIKCELDWVANFGFGEDEYHKCEWPAEFVGRDAYDDSKVKMCAHHRDRLKKTDVFRVYRFRRIA